MKRTSPKGKTMPLFVVRHQHDSKTCPAANPKMGAMLLQHVSKKNASSMGITMHGEAVVNGAHTFYLILEAPNQDAVKKYRTPFAQAGTVEILPSSTCETVVERAGC